MSERTRLTSYGTWQKDPPLILGQRHSFNCIARFFPESVDILGMPCCTDYYAWYVTVRALVLSLRFVLMSRKSRECTFKWCNNHLTIIVNKICTDSARSQSGVRRTKFHREKLSFVQPATRKTKFHWLWMNVMTRTSPESRCTNTRALSKKAEGRFTSVC